MVALLVALAVTTYSIKAMSSYQMPLGLRHSDSFAGLEFGHAIQSHYMARPRP